MCGKAETPSLRSQPGSHGLWGASFTAGPAPNVGSVRTAVGGGLESLGVRASAHTVCVCCVPGPVGSWVPLEGTRQGPCPAGAQGAVVEVTQDSISDAQGGGPVSVC